MIIDGAVLLRTPQEKALLLLPPLVCLVLVIRITSLYQTKAKGLSGFWTWLETSVEELGSSSYVRLALVSLLGLFLEMMMIRWISSEIRIFAYFKNFVLVATFLGFGLGCYLCRRRINFLALLIPVAAFTMMLALPHNAIREIFAGLPDLLGSSSEVQIWGVPAHPASWFGMSMALLTIVPLFALVAVTFIPIGQLVGRYLEESRNGVLGYTINILASLAGIALYTLLCFIDQPPATWFVFATVMLVVITWKVPRIRWASLAVFGICSALLLVNPAPGSKVFWSPYQKLTLSAKYEGDIPVMYNLSTNDSWYQHVVNLSPAFVASHPHDFVDGARWNPYNVPYHFASKPDSVLVLGAGTGNDVAAALRNGAGRVVGVEIDPLIRQLGRDLHFEHPYQSPRAHIVLNDARSYIQNSQDKFDLIVFSLLDSHTTSSYFTNIRIDNYVYTKEAMEQAKRLLKPDGLFIVKFWTESPWISRRLYNLVEGTFGTAPLNFMSAQETFGSGGHFYVSGNQQRLAAAMQDPEVRAFVESHHAVLSGPETRATTDDWPYFYQQAPGLPLSVILVSGAVVLVFAWFFRQVGEHGSGFQWHFFFLGAGFMLLEAQIVSKMALLFGTTWVVNSIVIAGLLVLIVAANMVHRFVPKIPTSLAYAGLFVTMIVGYMVPLERFFFSSLLLKAVSSTLVLCSPVFFAGIIFVSSFERAGFQGRALGANLFGSLAGGLLESLSMWFGLKSLLVVAALLYLASALTKTKDATQEMAAVAEERELVTALV